MTKKKLVNLDTEQLRAAETVQPLTPQPTRKVTPSTFAVQEKSKEISKVKTGETAAVENHYVNGSFTHTNSNRGK